MNTFGDAFKKERVKARKTLREISERTSRSIGYLSDIERGRKGVPELELVRKIEEVLGITNAYLLTLAAQLRTKLSPALTERMQVRPQLSELLCRADDLSDEDLAQLICEAQQLPEKRRREDSGT